MSEASDAAVEHAVADGGRREFERERGDAGLLFERYADDVYRYCRARGCSAADAEDVTAEVFAQALPRLGRLRWRRKPMVAFLYTVAGRRVADLARRRTREQPRHESAEVAGPAAGQPIGEALVRALSALPERQQEAVILRVVNGYSFAELAAATGTSEKSAKGVVYRGLDRMRAVLAEEGIEP